MEKPLHWIGSSKTDLLIFPEAVVDELGYVLGLVQSGRTPASAKPWKGEGAGMFDPSGIRTARTDVGLIRQRLKMARQDYEVRYGEKT